MMITREEFEQYVPSAVMPDERLFERIGHYLDVGLDVCRRLLGESLWPRYRDDLNLLNLVHRVACLHGYLEALPHMDVVLTEAGVGVVSNQNVAPASSDRVKRLLKQVQDSRDDAVDDLIGALRGVEAWRSEALAAQLFSSLVWNARMQLPIMGIIEAHRTKMTELRPKITAAEEVLQHHISLQLHAELCNAQLEQNATAKQNAVIHKSLFFIGAHVAGDMAMTRFHMAKLVEYLEGHLTDFPTYEASTAHQANTFTPYENKKDDTTYFFG